MNDKDSQIKSWFNRISTPFSSEPKNREELLNFLHIATEKQLIDDAILQMFDGALKLQELQVRDAMIPRAQIITIEQNLSFSQIVDLVVQSGHSRFPVVGENKDEVLGILLAKDLLAYTSPNNPNTFKINTTMRSPFIIPESKRLSSLLQDFQDNRSHLAVVVDEFGGLTGLITIEDVIEQIVGDIEDEHDIEESPYIKQTNENIYAVNALTTIDEFNEFFKTSLDSEDVETIGGLVMRELERLPQKGETLDINNFNFKIIKSDNRRIYLLEVITLV